MSLPIRILCIVAGSSICERRAAFVRNSRSFVAKMTLSQFGAFAAGDRTFAPLAPRRQFTGFYVKHRLSFQMFHIKTVCLKFIMNALKTRITLYNYNDVIYVLHIYHAIYRKNRKQMICCEAKNSFTNYAKNKQTFIQTYPVLKQFLHEQFRE